MKSVPVFIALLVGAGGFAVGQAGLAPTPFSLTIAAEKQAVKGGSEVVVDIALKNTSDHDVMLAECNVDGLDQYLSAEVRDERGKAVDGINCDKIQFNRRCADQGTVWLTTTNRELMCLPQVAGRVLKSGEVFSSKLPVNKLFDLGVPERYTIQMKRANYSVTYIRVPKKYGGYEDLAMDDKPSWGTAQSNTVMVTVTQ